MRFWRDLHPRPYQQIIIDHIVDNPRCAVWAGMGLGKTISTLTAIDALDIVEPGPVLVLAPLRVAATTWPDEIRKWDHLDWITVSPIIGNVTERKAAILKKAKVYTTNYENLPWLLEQVGVNWPWKTVIADESTRLKGFRLRQGGKRARALAKVAFSKIERFVELTGTPSPNGLIDLWGQVWYLDKGARLGNSYQAFQDRWFRQVRYGSDVHEMRLEPYPHTQAEIQERLKDLCVSLDAADHFDLDAPIVNVIRVKLPPKAEKLYRQMEEEMFVALDSGDEIEAFGAASKTIKCLQLANGAMYTESGFESIHDEKLNALEDILEEAAGMPVLVAYHFKSDLARLQKRFPKARVLDKNPQTIRDWNAGKIPMLFAHPQSAGHGLNLQDGGNIIAFFGHWWNLEEYQQIIERIGPTRQAQAGHKRPVFIHLIIAAGTVDEIVMKRRETKREVQDLLMEAMKR